MKVSLTLPEGKEIRTKSERLRKQADQCSQVATNSNKFKVVYGEQGVKIFTVWLMWKHIGLRGMEEPASWGAGSLF